MKRKLLEHPLFKTKITSSNVKNSESILGYLVGPFLALIINAVFTTFLNTFYTDVLGMVGNGFGNFLSLMPLISTVFVVVGNLLMGVVIDKTKTVQGKARPYILLAAPLLLLSTVLIFSVPAVGVLGKIIWVAISYNLYFAVAYPIYFLSHSMMVPLSTRNLKQRGGLSVITNMANIGAAGLFAAIVFPMFLTFLGVEQGNWLFMMAILGSLAFAGALLEFYFTRERITEEPGKTETQHTKIPLMQQLKGVVTSRYWWIIIVFYLLFQFGGSIKNLSMIYFSNYIVGTYNDGVTMPLLALLTGLPMSIGVFAVWPLANRFGKKNITVAGLLVSLIGSLLALLFPYNFVMVVIGITIKTVGSVPAVYVMMALFADVLDHLEYKNGYRSDGLSMSIFSILTVSSLGICTSIFNSLLSATGYLEPIGGIAQVQPAATQAVFIGSFIGVELVTYGILAILLLLLTVEKNIKHEQEIILQRQKEQVVSRGEVWMDPLEIARLEQEQNERDAEQARLNELQQKCIKKGLDFAREEEKYQAHLRKKLNKASRK